MAFTISRKQQSELNILTLKDAKSEHQNNIKDIDDKIKNLMTKRQDVKKEANVADSQKDYGTVAEKQMEFEELANKILCFLRNENFVAVFF